MNIFSCQVGGAGVSEVGLFIEALFSASSASLSPPRLEEPFGLARPGVSDVELFIVAILRASSSRSPPRLGEPVGPARPGVIEVEWFVSAM